MRDAARSGDGAAGHSGCRPSFGAVRSIKVSRLAVLRVECAVLRVERAGLRLERRHRFGVALGVGLHGFGVAFGAGFHGLGVALVGFATLVLERPVARVGSAAHDDETAPDEETLKAADDGGNDERRDGDPQRPFADGQRGGVIVGSGHRGFSCAGSDDLI